MNVDSVPNKTVSRAGLLLRLASVLLCALSYSAPLLHAEGPQRELKTESTEQVDAVLLIDSSGSMLQTDPKRLRDEGAKLFLQFLRPDDRVAIMQFDREAKLIRPFSPFSREEISAIAGDIARVSTQGVYTDLLAGVQAAGELLKKDRRPGAGGIIVLLSDGKMEPDPAVGQAYPRMEQLLNSELPALRSAGVKVHTLAFSELSDRKLLTDLATSTDGVGTFAPDADAIHQAFANLFLAVKKPQVLPLTSKGFSIDPDVREATFYVNREPEGEVTLISPAGKEFNADTIDDSVKWFRGGNFDVITLTAPQHGDWLLRGMIANDGFATVLTNLKLVSDWPSTITARDPTLLQARLNEGEKPVVLKEMSGSTRYALQIIPTDKVAEPVIEDLLFDDGTHGDKIAGDGIFSYRVNLPDPGEYKLWIVAKGPTFDRRQQIPFRVKPPLVAVRVLASEQRAEEATVDGHPEAGGGEHGEEKAAPIEDSSSTHENKGGIFKGRPGDRFLVELSSEAVLFKNMEVRLSAVDSERRKYRIPLEKVDDDLHYEALAEILPHTGLFELKAEISAESKKRGLIRELSRALKYERVEVVKEQADSGVVEVILEKSSEPKETNPSGIPQALLILLLDIALGVPLVMKSKKSQGSKKLTLPKFVSPEPALAAIAELTGRCEISEIDINSPLFASEAVIPPGVGEIPAAVSSAAEEESKAAEVNADSQAADASEEASAEVQEAEESSASDGGDEQEEQS